MGGESLTTADLAAGAEAREQRPLEQGRAEAGPAPLLEAVEVDDLLARWDAVQAGFVDDPRRAVERADELVAEVMKRLAETFADERRALESQLEQGGELSTEDLRVGLQRYRAFFQRLLST